ncbi:unnamed protein product [Prunus armeniaca]
MSIVVASEPYKLDHLNLESSSNRRCASLALGCFWVPVPMVQFTIKNAYELQMQDCSPHPQVVPT